ncbi:MAG: putative bifunctional diguanylate cyclase/phosphodiesterase [Actinomycetes bacterium]
MAVVNALPLVLRPLPWPAGETLLGASALMAGWQWHRRARERPEHRFLGLTSAAAFTWGGAQLFWTGVAAVDPSWGVAVEPVASALFWLGLVLGVAALLTVPLDVVAHGWVRLRAVAEAVLLAGATFVAIWLTLLGPVMDRFGVPEQQRLEAVVWCLADGMLIFLVLLVARYGRTAVYSAGIRVGLLTTGLTFVAIGDVSLYRVSVTGIHSVWLDVLYVAGWALLAMAPGRPGPMPARGTRSVRALEGRGVPVAVAVAAVTAGLVATSVAASPDPVLLWCLGVLVVALGLVHVPVQRQGALTARHLESELDHRRTHDPLTDLLTRDALLTGAHTQVGAGDTARGQALVLIRLRSVETVRSSVGDGLADRMITVAADRLREVSRGLGLARWGDGDLAALCPEEDGPDVARRYAAALDVPVTVRGRERSLAPVCAILPLRLTEFGGIRDDARAALDAAEVPGVTGPVGFSASLRADAAVRRRLGHDLEEAVAAGAVDVAFQPVVDVRTGRATGAEALARWTHPELGPVSPAVFVPLAEHRGCVDALGALVLDRALAEAARWQKAGLSIPVSVNVSMLQLSAPCFLEVVAGSLARHDLVPQSLVLEVTETVLAEDTAGIRDTLTRVREFGVGVALDDFGTGYCSLAYLHTFPADVLKVDRALVDGARDDPQRAVMLRAVAAMADALGLDATAEGVGTPDEASLLVELGVAHAQGYHYARPMTAADFTTWLSGEEGGVTSARLDTPTAAPTATTGSSATSGASHETPQALP